TETRLAQAHIQIDQAGTGNQAAGVYGHGGLEALRGVAEGVDQTVVDMHVGDLVELAGRVDHPGAADGNTHAHSAPCLDWRWVVCPAMAIDITAMRTAMPEVSCLRITDWAPSATADSISTPRLIGPGCIAWASGLA